MSKRNPNPHDPRPDLLGKCCITCGVYKFTDEYTRIRKGSEDRQGSCKECIRAKQRANPTKYARNLEWIQRKWREDEDWKQSQLAYRTHYRHSRREQGTLAANAFVDRAVVFERDNYTCQLCGELMDMSGPPRAPLAPSVDHIVPMSRGGAHSYENVQSAHLFCNMSKGPRDAPKKKPSLIL